MTTHFHQPPPKTKHPLVLALLWGLVVATSCTLVNAIPQTQFGTALYYYGWPETFRTYVTNPIGIHTIPLQPSSPYIRFDTYALLRDALGCSLLISLTTVSAWRLLIRYSFQLQFTLATILVFITTTCILLAIYRSDPTKFLLLHVPCYMVMFAAAGVILLAILDLLLRPVEKTPLL